MLRIPVIDLGSQWTHRIWRTLKYLGVETEILSVDTKFDKLKADALVFSGGAIRISLGEGGQIDNAATFLEKFNGPTLGICAGQQFIGLKYGGKAIPSKNPEFGKVDLIIDDHNELFEGLPDKFTVWASHNDEVVDVPNFKILAHSKDCSNHAMKHNKKPVYGCLFHPEVEHSQHGAEIYKNFVKLVKK